jgi:hypothetical protein
MYLFILVGVISVNGIRSTLLEDGHSFNASFYCPSLLGVMMEQELDDAETALLCGLRIAAVMSAGRRAAVVAALENRDLLSRCVCVLLMLIFIV